MCLIGATKANSITRKKCSNRQTAQAQLRCGQENVRRGTTTLHFLRRHKKVGTSKSRKSVRRSAHYVINYGYRHIQRANYRMLPAHYNGWVCIHQREAAWNDANAPYYGGLQMSWNWMKAVPGGDAGKLSPLHQMRIAERVSATQGFSYDWMHGQWPNTYPPCASYF